MPRTLSPDVLEQKGKDYNRPVELYRIELDEETLYYAMYPENIEFFDENGSAQTYYAAGISRDSIKKNNQTSPNSTTVTFDNVIRNFSSFVANTEFVGRKVTIWKVFLDANREVINLAKMGMGPEIEEVLEEGAGLEYNNSYIEIFTNGIIDSISIDEYNLTATIVSNLDVLDVELPSETYQVNCRFEFGKKACGKIIPKRLGVVTGIINEEDYQKITYNEGSNDAENYWKNGSIEIGTEDRIITASGKGYVKVEYPFFGAEINDNYEVKAGCDYSYDGEHGCEFWENTQFYGGFLEIPKIRNIREV